MDVSGFADIAGMKSKPDMALRFPEYHQYQIHPHECISQSAWINPG